MDMGFVKVAAVSPRVEVANPRKNAQTAVEAVLSACSRNAQIIVLPELYLSGYTCADLFAQDKLLEECEKALIELMSKTQSTQALIAVGMPLKIGRCLYNVAAVLQKGKILGFVPKSYIPNYNEFYEKRWFAAGKVANIQSVNFKGGQIPFGRLLFRLNNDVTVGIEICEDLWIPIPPSSFMSLEGANIILNPSASNEIVTKHDYRRELIKQQSARCNCAYVFASEGPGESTTDLVFSGACVIAENGVVIADSDRFQIDGSSAIACIDTDRLNSERIKRSSFSDNVNDYSDFAEPSRIIECSIDELPEDSIDRKINPYPFVPQDERERDERCNEILSIQSMGLAKRMLHTKMDKVIIGISGGLDSTLALLVSKRAMESLNLPPENIICITMPGFGTTDITYTNAIELIDTIGAQKREIDIRPACIQHMKDIGQDQNVHDVTYENVQARERTHILMDLANKENALLIGTGDLSELAMGWCTYNGDHMSMYGVNCSVPKTLVKHLVRNVADNSSERLCTVLQSVLDTPVSPELLPPTDDGKIQQKTEEQIGPYELHDFFLYYFMRFGTNPEKLKFLAGKAFAGKYNAEEIDKWLQLFIKRFFVSQFKRSCLPDGPKVGTVSLSPRGDWRMPSDASCEIWLK